MNPDWQNFLTQHGATLDAGVVQRFGDTAAELVATSQGTVLCDLSQFGILKVSGEDAQNFLQNLFSSDVKNVTPAQAQLSSFNTAKGRMLASFLIWQGGSEYFLQLPRSLCGAMQKKLSMYVLRAKVKIADASDELVCLGVSGTNAAALLKEYVTSLLPQELHGAEGVAQMGGIAPNPYFTVIRLGDSRFQVNTAPQNAPALWQKLAKDARPAGSSCWDWLNIRDGIPIIMPATQEQFVAQMANLDLIGGVSFKKGCYPGQEIVARMQYLGKLKRRMYLAHIEGNTAPQPSDELYSADMEGQASGMVVNATAAPGGGCDLLAVVQISSREAQTVHLQSLQGAALNFLPLPYTIP
ncbi:MAG: folate-binding protein YgfZ [Betaproteobacteria bacterium]|nr:folate-binding protein YgfZ [Betaproteobacteria bacterium]